MFGVEIALFASATSPEDCQKRLQKKMLAILPQPEAAGSAELTLQQLHALAESKLYRFSPDSAQSKVVAVQKVVGRIVDRKAVDTTLLSQDPLLRICVQRFASFCTFTTPATTDAAAVTVVGKAAIAAHLGAAGKAVEDGTATFDTIAQLVTFKYLAPVSDHSKLQALVDSVKDTMSQLESKKKKAKTTVRENAASPEDVSSYYVYVICHM